MTNPLLEFEWASLNQSHCSGLYGEGHIFRIPGNSLLSAIHWQDHEQPMKSSCMPLRGQESAHCNHEMCSCLCTFKNSQGVYVLGEEYRATPEQPFCSGPGELSKNYLLAYLDTTQHPLTFLEAFDHSDPFDYAAATAGVLLVGGAIFLISNTLSSYMARVDIISFMISVGYTFYIGEPRLILTALKKR
ncbi:MAG: hypothetical protein ACR2PX_11105 [Endozoicomonas sp.]|uniref:hypothetical protein n=1 Tax=Endozoicomonas sp. TaxID=1892382 RepID=UPI003D9AF5E9